MSNIRFDSPDRCIGLEGQPHQSVVVTSATAGCSAAPGVEEIRVGNARLRGVVTMAGGVSVAGSTIFVTGGNTGGVSRLSELVDVIASDPANGSLLRFIDDPSNALNGYWVASQELDGGGYA